MDIEEATQILFIFLYFIFDLELVGLIKIISKTLTSILFFLFEGEFDLNIIFYSSFMTFALF